MYEEPYRWVEAVGNRRQYLDEQFRQGSPVVAASYADGILLLTVSRGIPKLYEVYDRIGLAGMGHPADLEKLRFSLLEMAHLEGFNRSPSDVSASRLMKYGLAPAVKQAFEEIFKAPFVVKILLADLSLKPGLDRFLTVDYDGSFDETPDLAVLAATPAIRTDMTAYLKQQGPLTSAPLAQALDVSLRTWAVGALAQASDEAEPDRGQDSGAGSKTIPAAPASTDRLLAHLRETLTENALECALLERQMPSSSKYRALRAADALRLIPNLLPP